MSAVRRLATMCLDPEPTIDDLIARLPADWRDTARRELKLDARSIALWCGRPSEELPRLFSALVVREGAAQFVLENLRALPCADHRALAIHSMLRARHWQNYPGLDSFLEDVAAGDPDDSPALAALETLRRIEMRRLGIVLRQRLVRRRAISPDAIAEMEDAEERWMMREAGIAIPDFMRRPPPVFAPPIRSEQLRVLAFGDFGYGTTEQNKVADAMAIYAARRPIDFGLVLGDNFYPSGLDRPDDPRSARDWEGPYGRLAVPFYAVLGNHDWQITDSPAAQIVFGHLSQTFKLPALYYSFVAGPVQFFALETTYLSDLQLRWLDQELAASSARWKIVVTHYPLEFVGRGGLTVEPNFERLRNVYAGRVDVHLAGHYHKLWHIAAGDGLHSIVSGTAGGGTLSMAPQTDPRVRFASAAAGFVVLEIAGDRIDVCFLDDSATEIYCATIRKAALRRRLAHPPKGGFRAAIKALSLRASR